MIVNESGIRLIAECEGFAARPYNDPVGICTVGYGEVIRFSACTATDFARPPITIAQGQLQLREKVKPYAAAVTTFTSVALTSNQYAALASFTYNVGQGGYRDSSVRRAVNSSGNVCAELRKYIKGINGVTYPGLIRRREAECTLFNRPDAPKPEEEEMAVQLVWCPDRVQVFQIGSGDTKPIIFPQVADELRRIYGPEKVAMSWAALQALGAK